MTDKNAFIRLVRNRFSFSWFLLSKLPSAYFSGLRIQTINSEKCVVSVPYRWFTKNPFRSTYFACLAMAAELSTGALAMAMIYGRQPRVSMLVVKLEADYFKKATGTTYFSCNDGALFETAVQAALDTGEVQTVKATATGLNSDGALIARFGITWSFKTK